MSSLKSGCFSVVMFLIVDKTSGLPAPNHLKKRDFGIILNKKKRDLKGPIFNQNMDKLKKGTTF